MTHDPLDSDLDRRVDRALKSLPTPAAPPELAGRIMRAIEARDAIGAPASSAVHPFEWPIAVKIAVCFAGAALVLVALVGWPIALEFLRTGWQSPAVTLVRTAANAARPMVPAGLVYVTAMCAALAAVASMLKHVALGGAQQS